MALEQISVSTKEQFIAKPDIADNKKLTYTDVNEIVDKTNLAIDEITDYATDKQKVFDENEDAVAQGVDGKLLTVNNRKTTLYGQFDSTSENNAIDITIDSTSAQSMTFDVSIIGHRGDAGQSGLLKKTLYFFSYSNGSTVLNNSKVTFLTGEANFKFNISDVFFDTDKFKFTISCLDLRSNFGVFVTARQGDENQTVSNVAMSDAYVKDVSALSSDIQSYTENYIFVDLLADGTLGSDSEDGVTATVDDIAETQLTLTDTDYEVIGAWATPKSTGFSSTDKFSSNGMSGSSVFIRHGVYASVAYPCSVLLKIAKI